MNIELTWNYIAAQILGIIALIILAISLQKNDSTRLLKLQTLSSFVYSLMYLVLKAWTGYSLTMVCIVRNYIYRKYENKKIPIYLVIDFCAMMITLTMIFWDGWISILPAIAMISYTIALSTRNMKVIRITEIIACFIYIYYGIAIGAYTGAIATVFEMIIALVAVIRFDILKKDRKKEKKKIKSM